MKKYEDPGFTSQTGKCLEDSAYSSGHKILIERDWYWQEKGFYFCLFCRVFVKLWSQIFKFYGTIQLITLELIYTISS